ncbi:MAG: hypothetical protein GSR73_00005 [Desulfurococcales archaeon]|nr:hypothetical protein [Desulfurococcales archaeon]
MTSRTEIMAQLLSMKLEEHLRAMETIEGIARELASTDMSSRSPEELRDAVSRLRSLRSALLKDALRVVDAIENGDITPGGDGVEELYALAGYYVEAAYHSEKRLLSMLGGYVDDSDRQSMELLRSVFSRILSSLE